MAEKKKKKQKASDTLTEAFFRFLATENQLNLARNLARPGSPVPPFADLKRIDPLRKDER